MQFYQQGCCALPWPEQLLQDQLLMSDLLLQDQLLLQNQILLQDQLLMSDQLLQRLWGSCAHQWQQQQQQ
jgi:hypothetical protein